MPAFIDLHIHSNKSDGEFSPEEVVSLSKNAGLAAISITDHDNCDAYPGIVTYAAAQGVEVIPGIEIGIEYKKKHACMLGYFIDCNNPELKKTIQTFKRERAERNEHILSRLIDAGCQIERSDLEKFGEFSSIGRPQFAAVLIEKGYAKNIKRAFDKYLVPGKAGYEPKQRMKPQKAIEVIHQAGGLASLAHPGLLKYDKKNAEILIRDMKEWGLDAVECYYSWHDPAVEQIFLILSKKYDLAVTGGSDYHGPVVSPLLSVGRGRGDIRITTQLTDKLKTLL